jgi:hypothetical protein
MNTRADDLTVILRAILGTLPGATSISLYAVEAWAILLITTSTDEAVIALSEDLELGAVEFRTGDGRWWCRASSERDQGRLRVVVAGPHHMSPPPHDDDGEASSRSA